MAPPPGRTATFSDRASALVQRPGVRQLVKFCLVGATSTVIDKGTLWILVNDLLPDAPARAEPRAATPMTLDVFVVDAPGMLVDEAPATDSAVDPAGEPQTSQ